MLVITGIQTTGGMRLMALTRMKVWPGWRFPRWIIPTRQINGADAGSFILFCIQSDINYPIKTGKGLDEGR